MSREYSQTFMKERAILPLVLSMSIPMVMSMAVNALYNIVDSYFVAKISEDAMTALSLVFPIQNLIGAVAIGYGVGGCSAISFFLGAQKQREADASASLGYIIAFIHGLILALVCIAGIRPFLSCFTDSEEIVELGCQYAYVVFAFSPALNLGMHAEKVLQAAGRMTDTMLCMLAGCIFNIIMDPMLIFGIGPFPEMGMYGAALATGMGQLIAFLLYAGAGVIKPLPVRIRIREYLSPAVFAEDLKSGASVILRIYTVGIPAALNLALPSLMITVLNAILAALGGSYVLVLGAYYKLQTFLYLTVNGIIQGIRPIVGYNYGAREYGRVKKTEYVTLALSVAVMIVGTALCLLIPQALIGLFTENAETIAVGAAALRIICCGFVVSTLSVTVSGVLEGIGRGRSSLIISLCRYIVIILPVAFVLSRMIGAAGVWHAFWITELATALISLKLQPIKGNMLS